MTAATRGYIRVRVVPRASRSALTRDATGHLRAHVTAAPIEGAANRALVALLAEHLGVAKSAIEVTRGERGRDKLLRVSGLSAHELDARLQRVL